MTFGGNTTPKKKKLPAPKAWQCKCPRPMAAFIAYCSRCNTGRPK
jgi:hypothetical protein